MARDATGLYLLSKLEGSGASGMAGLNNLWVSGSDSFVEFRLVENRLGQGNVHVSGHGNLPGLLWQATVLIRLPGQYTAEKGKIMSGVV